MEKERRQALIGEKGSGQGLCASGPPLFTGNGVA
jgi:hypothetical protein